MPVLKSFSSKCSVHQGAIFEVASPESHRQFVVGLNKMIRSGGLYFVLWHSWGSPSWRESWWGGKFLAPIGKLNLSVSWRQLRSHSRWLHEGSRVWQWWDLNQSDPVTRSRLCPHCAVLLDFCPFSELFSSLLLRELLFCSGLVNWCLLLESRNADHYNTARAHSRMLIKADSPYQAPMAVISLIEYSYSWHSRTSYLLLQLFRFPQCVVFCQEQI